MSPAERRSIWLVPALFAVVAGLPAITGDFIRDDYAAIAANPHVVGAVPLGEIFRSPFQPLGDAGLWRPVTTLSLRLCLVISGGYGSEDASTQFMRGADPRPGYRPWVFHGTNLLLAAVAAALVAGLMTRLGAPRWSAILGAVIFAVHPARTEAVCWISGQAEDLMTAAALGALVVAAKPGGPWRAIVAALLTFLAVAAKEQGFVVPLLIAGLPGLPTRDRLTRTLACAAVAAGAWMWRAHVVGGGTGIPDAVLAMPDLSLVTRILHAVRFLGDYGRLMLWPVGLRHAYDIPHSPPGLPDLAVGGLMLLLLISQMARAWTTRRRSPRAAFGAWLILITLAPVLNIVPIGVSFAERFLALPIAGLALMIGATKTADTAPAPTSSRVLRLAAVVVLLGMSVNRACKWWTAQRLADDLVAARPASSVANLVAAQAVPNSFGAEAATLLERAVALDPLAPRARIQLQMVDWQFRPRPRQNGIPSNEEVAFAEETIRLAPHTAYIHVVLGFMRYDRGEKAEGMREVARAFDIDPGDKTAADLLGLLLDRDGRSDEAMSVRDRHVAALCRRRQRAPGFAPVVVPCIRACVLARRFDMAGRIADEALAHPLRPEDVEPITNAARSIPTRATTRK